MISGKMHTIPSDFLLLYEPQHRGNWLICMVKMQILRSSWLLLAIFSLCSAIFQEQLGEYDWKKENIGFIERSVQFHDKLFVATSEDVVSSINVRNGGINWRALYPKSSTFEQILVVNDCVVVLSTQKTQNDFSTSLLRGLSITDGSLMWELSLGAVTSSDTKHSDIMFDSTSNLLVVLFRNSLYFVTPPLNSRSSSAVDVWFWSPEDSEDGKWTISSLIVPTTFVDQSKEKSGANIVARVALGCHTSGVSSSSCDKTAVWKVNKNTKTVTTDAFFGLDVAHPTQIRGTVSSDDRFGFGSEDNLFAVHHGKDGYALALVNLQSNEVSEAQINVPEGAVVDEVPNLFVFADRESDIKPAVSVCYALKGVKHCSAFVARTAASGLTLASVDSTDCAGTSALLLSEPAAYYQGLTSTFDCIGVRWNENDSLLESLSYSSSSGLVNQRVELNVVHPSHSALTTSGTSAGSAFRHVVVTRATDNGSGGKSSVVVIVLHSGLTVGLSVSNGSGKVLWTRDEAITHIRSVELVDVDKKAAAAGDNTVMPSVVERLAMQKEELVVS